MDDPDMAPNNLLITQGAMEEEAQKASEQFQKVLDSVAPSITKINEMMKPIIDVDFFKERELPAAIISPEAQRERNEWKRHIETIEKQTAILTVQTELLKEQKGNTTLSWWILGFSAAALIVAILSLVVAALPLFQAA